MGVIDPKRARAMIEKRLATQERNRVAAAQADQHRRGDELELAKAYLRREGGFNVYARSTIAPGSDLIMVGTVAMTPDEVIAKAASVRERRAGR